MPLETSERTFVNRSGCWTHEGPFTVEFVKDTDKGELANAAGAMEVLNDLLVTYGRAEFFEDEILFTVGSVHGTFPKGALVAVRSQKDGPLWVNDAFRK